MVKAFVIAAAIASVAVAQTEIVNGTEAPVGKYLYVSGLRKTETGRASCGGSLIAPTVLLTAAHCAGAWSNTTVGPYTLKFASIGSHFTAGDKDGERIEIVKQTIHPKYNDTIFDYDFAIFELKSPSKYAPVQISWDHQPEGVTSWIRGFGDTTSGGDQPDVLLEASVVTWDQKKCADKYASIAQYGEEVTDSMLCAGGLDKDTCQGDSGGPLTFVKDGQEFLAGVTSWGIGCADVGVPGVYSRISKARDFIEPFLAKPAC